MDAHAIKAEWIYLYVASSVSNSAATSSCGLYQLCKSTVKYVESGNFSSVFFKEILNAMLKMIDVRCPKEYFPLFLQCIMDISLAIAFDAKCVTQEPTVLLCVTRLVGSDPRKALMCCVHKLAKQCLQVLNSKTEDINQSCIVLQTLVSFLNTCLISKSI